MKKITTILLATIILLNVASFAYAAEEGTPFPEDFIEEYTNTRSVFASLSISTNGTATIGITCVGLSGTTHISSITYLEKWNGSSWVRVSINGANQISASSNAGYLSRTYTTTVASGKYRATAIFTVTNGTNETVTVRSNTATR